MQIITEKMVVGGSCIAHLNGKVIFIPFSLPNETHEIRITEEKKDYNKALTTSILDPCAQRISPRCPYFGRCGGCNLQMTTTEYQQELKIGILTNTLERAGIYDFPRIELVKGPDFEYRSRFQFHVQNEKNIGLKEALGSKIIPLHDCPIAVPVIRKALQDGSLAHRAVNAHQKERFVVFSQGDNLFIEGEDKPCFAEICGKKIDFAVQGFFQSNLFLLEKLVQTIQNIALKTATKNLLLDFYAGVGTFASFISKNFTKTILVEQSSTALAYAQQNCSPSTIECLSIKDSLWPTAKQARLAFDLAIIDPPRLGLSKTALDWFCSKGPALLLYVSCDPVSFARDSKKLIHAGYVLENLQLYDFYPQTHHIESLGVFSR